MVASYELRVEKGRNEVRGARNKEQGEELSHAQSLRSFGAEVGVVFTNHCLRGSVAFCHIVSLDTGILPLYTEVL
jgi:hypothetical protein